MELYPVRIKRTDEKLFVKWNDGLEAEIPLKVLRDECPCATCKDESNSSDTYIPIKNPFKEAGFYEIDTISKVGNYAVQITWKDGHHTGIYSWELLREYCTQK